MVNSYQLSSRVQQAESAEKTEDLSMMDVRTCLNEHKQVSYVRLQLCMCYSKSVKSVVS